MDAPTDARTPRAAPVPTMPPPLRDPAPMLEQVRQQWGGRRDLWVFGYASLIWNPQVPHAERRAARVHGWHRALQMWSRVNRGTPECPGLVYALLSGGCCDGIVLRVPRRVGHEALDQLWAREMPTGVYDPRWLRCHTPHGEVSALAFTLSRKSPNYTGRLDDARYRQIFTESCGRYGTTLDYARQTYDSLLAHGVRDRALERLLRLARA